MVWAESEREKIIKKIKQRRHCGLQRCGWQTTSEEEKCEEFFSQVFVSFQLGKEEGGRQAMADTAQTWARMTSTASGCWFGSAILIIKIWEEEEAFGARKRSTTQYTTQKD